MTQANRIIRRYRTNRTAIRSWLFMARHAIRCGDARRSLEATYSALWLMGATDDNR